MEITICDSALNPLGVIDEITSFLWTRRYWSCGEFKLLVPYSQRHIRYLKKRSLLTLRGRDEAGEIRFVSIRKNEWGMEEIEAQGRFLTGWLGKRLVLQPIVADDLSQNILCRAVRENLAEPVIPDRRIPNLSVDGLPDLGGGVIHYASEPYASALFVCEDVAKQAGLGFGIFTDQRSKTHAFRVYRGRDLTTGQTERPPCVFSQEFDNVLEQEFVTSAENYRSAAYIGGQQQENVPRVVAEVGGGSGLDRDEMFVDASDIQRGNLTESAYTGLLCQRGLETLERHGEALSFQSRVNPHANLRYREDFDLGDVVTCVDRRWGVRINARITEITEIYQEETMGLDVVFGESLPTLLDKLRR